MYCILITTLINHEYMNSFTKLSGCSPGYSHPCVSGSSPFLSACSSICQSINMVGVAVMQPEMTFTNLTIYFA